MEVKLSVVLPAYKEKGNLAVFVPQIEAEFKDIPHEVIIVDDNSKDGTRELAEELREEYGNVLLIERPGLLGIGSALRDGYNGASGEYILSSDSDLSFSAKDMRRLFVKIQDGFDLVLGYRIRQIPGAGAREKRSWHSLYEDYIISPMSNWIIRIVSGISLRNYNTNFRAFRSSLWRRIRTKENRQFFLFETIVRAKRSGAKIAEIPATFSPRKFGESKVNFFKEAPGYFLKLLRIVFIDR